jgi:sporulation protein YlmC with PRC-barrel domain
MKKLPIITVASTLSLILAAPAFATDPGREGIDQHRASKIIGENVENMKGDNIGEVKDIVIGPDGNVSYVVVSSGGMLGAAGGGKLHPVPWQALRWSKDKDNYVLNVDPETFKNTAPTLSGDQWPLQPSTQWNDFYRQHAGVSFSAMEQGRPTQQGRSTEQGRSTGQYQ